MNLYYVWKIYENHEYPIVPALDAKNALPSFPGVFGVRPTQADRAEFLPTCSLDHCVLLHMNFERVRFNIFLPVSRIRLKNHRKIALLNCWKSTYTFGHISNKKICLNFRVIRLPIILFLEQSPVLNQKNIKV